MCSECQFEHQKQTSGDQIVPINILIKMMEEKIQQYHLNDHNYIMNKEKNFFTKIEEIKQGLDLILRNSSILIEEIKKEDNWYLDLLQQNPLECTQENINNIAYIFYNSKELQRRQNQKDLIVKIYESKLNLVCKYFKRLMVILGDQIYQNKKQAFDNKILQGPLLLGLKHGEYFQIGAMKFDEKAGLWKDEGKQLFRSIQNLKWLFQTTQFQYEIKSQGQIIYLKDGTILGEENRDKMVPSLNNVFINRNLEQVKHLSWIGQYKQNYQKQGKWIPIWRGENLEAGGTYNVEGIKEGQWKELSSNYCDFCKVFYVGEYIKGKKVGKWNINFEEQIIEGGFYNQIEMKQGKWTELGDSFWNQSQIFFIGEYKKGLKVGNWNINYRYHKLYDQKRIGGGYFSQNGEKTGEWIELHPNFFVSKISSCQVTFHGTYQNGIKIGEWLAIFQEFSNSEERIIGRGFYNKNGLKIGKWIDVVDKFWIFCQVTEVGEYNEGRRIKNWEIQTSKFKNENNSKIGGGSYQEDAGLKIGQWSELHENFFENCDVIYSGEYKNGIRVGKWIIKQKQKNLEKYKKIGGGTYNQDGQKVGKWIDLFENFSEYSIKQSSEYQVFFIGEYQMGRKIGRWNISVVQLNNTHLENYGGGFYNERGLKVGTWVELHETNCANRYSENSFNIIYAGVYQEGKKIGRWDTKYREEEQDCFQLMQGKSQTIEEAVVIIKMEQKQGSGLSQILILKINKAEIGFQRVNMNQEQEKDHLQREIAQSKMIDCQEIYLFLNLQLIQPSVGNISHL
ncbi:unnamed protein product [Paramecium pentaurelia]|uniref:Uncharacterized protein n=1 Tax=Paramecium pentaurelia TaxID=43138 RepID=A0A8S1SSX1_9CILI|nr:unnamed protein product [Paramecium pentaurelia]